MQQPEIVALQSFVTVVEVGGFSRAAEKPGSTTAEVSRRAAPPGKRLGAGAADVCANTARWNPSP